MAGGKTSPTRRKEKLQTTVHTSVGRVRSKQWMEADSVFQWETLLTHWWPHAEMSVAREVVTDWNTV